MSHSIYLWLKALLPTDEHIESVETAEEVAKVKEFWQIEPISSLALNLLNYYVIPDESSLMSHTFWVDISVN